MPNVDCQECDLRVHPRNGICPSCGASINTNPEERPNPEIPPECFSGKAIQRKKMWPATLSFVAAFLSFCATIVGAFLPTSIYISLFACGTLCFLFFSVSYLWYVRVIVSIKEDSEGIQRLYVQHPGGKTRKIRSPFTLVHSWSRESYPVLILGHAVKTRKRVLSLSVEDKDGKRIMIFQEEVRTNEAVPPDWPEIENRYEKENIYDCFPLPRFNLPLLKSAIDQIRVRDRSDPE